MPEISPEVYYLDIWHLPGTGFSGVDVSRVAGGPLFTFPPQANSCAACAQVPTLGQWGMILLSLLLLTFGLVALRSHQPVLAGSGGASFPSGYRQLPFNKTVFSKMLVFVMLGLAVVFAVSVVFFGYEMNAADIPGSFVAGPLMAYLLHLVFGKQQEQ